MAKFWKSVRKIAKIAVPVIFAMYGGGVWGSWLSHAGGLLGTIYHMSALEAYALGSALMNLGGKRKGAGDTGQESPVYGLSPARNTLSNVLPVPIIYGKVRTAGNIIYSDQASSTEVHRAIALCEGPVTEISEIQINNRPWSDFTGCSVAAYTGTATQANDPLMVNYKGGVHNLAYLMGVLKASDQLRSDGTFTAVVKGKKIPNWDGVTWDATFSRNPAWITRDFLTSVACIPSAQMDVNSFISVGAWCSATVTGEYDRDRNVCLSATVTGGENPARVNDGSKTTANNGCRVAAVQNSATMTHLCSVTLAQVEYTNFAKLWLWDGDDRACLGFRVIGINSAGASVAIASCVATGQSYKGVQYLEFTAGNYVGFRIEGAASDTDPAGSEYFHVMEFEVFNLIPAQRFTLDVILDTERTAREILQDMLAAFGGYIVYSDGKIKLRCDGMQTTIVKHFDDTNTIADTLSVEELPEQEKPNRMVVYFINPWNGWIRDDVSDDDTADQATNGIRQKEIALLYCTRPSQAKRLCRQALNLARSTRWVAGWDAGLNAATCEPGDLVTRDCSWMGWDAKTFKLLDIAEMPDGRRRVAVREYLSSIYGDQAGAYYESGANSTLPDPLKDVPRHVSAMTISEDKDQPGDGTWIPKINVTFTPPSDNIWNHADIELSESDAAHYYVVGQSDGSQAFEIKGLKSGSTYYVRVVSVNQYGVRAPVGTAPQSSVLLVGKDVAPENVTGFNYSITRGGIIDLVWNRAIDANNDVDHYEIRNGVSWSAGTVLISATATTHIGFKPDKRAWQLLIKARDRSGNESAAATSCSFTVTAPTIVGIPDLAQLPPNAIHVEGNAPANGNIIRYDIHAGVSAGFTCNSTTLVATAAPGFGGVFEGQFIGSASVTYVVKCAAIDFLSDAVGDSFDHMSSEASIACRLIESNDITAHNVLANHLYANQMILGGVGSCTVGFKILNSVGATVGAIGLKSVNSSSWGGFFSDFLQVGPDSAPLMLLDNTGMRVTQNIYCGTSGTANKIASSGEPGMNLCPNGGFEDVKKGRVYWGSDANILPEWAIGGGGGANDVFLSALPGDYGYVNSARGIGLSANGVTPSVITRGHIPVYAGSTYQLYADFRTNIAANIPSHLRCYWYDKDKVYLSYSQAILDATNINGTTFQRLGGTVTAPVDANYAQILIAVGTAGANWLWVDNVKFERGNVPTAYSETPRTAEIGRIGITIETSTGFNIYTSVGAQAARMGCLAGLAKYDGTTYGASDMGIWNMGLFEFRDANNNPMFCGGGILSSAFVNSVIAKAALQTGLQALIQTAGNTDGSRPHDWHFALIASGTTALTSTFATLASVSHGQSTKPMVIAEVRGRQADTSTSYSFWHTLPFTSHGTPGASLLSWTTFYYAVTSTGIVFDAIWSLYNIGSGTLSQGHMANASQNYAWLLSNDQTTWRNIWDKWEIHYVLLRAGG